MTLGHLKRTNGLDWRDTTATVGGGVKSLRLLERLRGHALSVSAPGSFSQARCYRVLSLLPLLCAVCGKTVEGFSEGLYKLAQVFPVIVIV